MKATVMYVVDGTTTEKVITGHRILVQTWNDKAQAGDTPIPAFILALSKKGKVLRRLHVARCWFVDIQ